MGAMIQAVLTFVSSFLNCIKIILFNNCLYLPSLHAILLLSFGQQELSESNHQHIGGLKGYGGVCPVSTTDLLPDLSSESV